MELIVLNWVRNRLKNGRIQVSWVGAWICLGSSWVKLSGENLETFSWVIIGHKICFFHREWDPLIFSVKFAEEEEFFFQPYIFKKNSGFSNLINGSLEPRRFLSNQWFVSLVGVGSKKGAEIKGGLKKAWCYPRPSVLGPERQWWLKIEYFSLAWDCIDYSSFLEVLNLYSCLEQE
jgi:hypothetical protein